MIPEQRDERGVNARGPASEWPQTSRPACRRPVLSAVDMPGAVLPSTYRRTQPSSHI